MHHKATAQEDAHLRVHPLEVRDYSKIQQWMALFLSSSQMSFHLCSSRGRSEGWSELLMPGGVWFPSNVMFPGV